MSERWDVVVVGAGPAGIATSVTAAERGARVLLLERADDVGGALPWSGGHLSAGGTSLQRARGIVDSPAQHLADVERINRGTSRRDLTALSLAEQPAVVEWLLDAGWEVDPATPRVVHGHEQYLVARTVHGPELPGGPGLLRVLRGVLESSRVAVRTASPVSELLVEGGRVVGVVAAGEQHRARAVVLATGGFGHDPELFEELEGVPLVTSAAPTSTGDGIRLGRAVGAGIQGRGAYLPTFGGLPPEPGQVRVDWLHRPQLVAPERPPWEVYVDVHGRRWVAEDETSIDAKERALVRLPRMTFWTVFDARALRESQPMVHGWSPQELDAAAGVRRGVTRAATLHDLAVAAGIDPEGLSEAVASYNRAVEAGVDPAFGRRHLPAPVAEPPFYALENHPVTLITFAGLDVDAGLRVRDAEGAVVPGLWAVGEVIGSAAVNGNAFCSGMCLTPALALGRVVGRALS